MKSESERNQEVIDLYRGKSIEKYFGKKADIEYYDDDLNTQHVRGVIREHASEYQVIVEQDDGFDVIGRKDIRSLHIVG
jgi:hypothetical protein